ncbi:glycosyltransferase family 2 protein [Haloparvum sedimenti]|uniref:glycosyltransferase family 2 protein n=1 Tax=Haloparvum sedimenti TaxID=1678448 RepID=UPI00071E6FAE|nr:glycosyltransferase [Haloparvum sedimenti]
MKLSVVVPTLNGRDRLGDCLDALSRVAPDAEVVVVNGPSADGTTGMVRDREDVDVLVELSDRTVNVARNAGIEVAGGDVVALVDFDHRVETGWLDALREGLDRAAVVTGPVREAGDGEDTSSEPTDVGPERRTIAGREVTYVEGGNVAFRRGVLDDLDGFDEYLETGGSRDAAHRLAGMDHKVAFSPDLAVTHESAAPTAVDGGRDGRDWGWKYRALAYRLVKNYGVRPTVLRRTLSHAASDSLSVARDVFGGRATPSGWIGNGRDVLAGIATGASDGAVARRRDRSPARNPHGISTRADRAVAKYEWR